MKKVIKSDALSLASKMLKVWSIDNSIIGEPSSPYLAVDRDCMVAKYPRNDENSAYREVLELINKHVGDIKIRYYWCFKNDDSLFLDCIIKE